MNLVCPFWCTQCAFFKHRCYVSKSKVCHWSTADKVCLCVAMNKVCLSLACWVEQSWNCMPFCGKKRLGWNLLIQVDLNLWWVGNRLPCWRIINCRNEWSLPFELTGPSYAQILHGFKRFSFGNSLRLLCASVDINKYKKEWHLAIGLAWGHTVEKSPINVISAIFQYHSQQIETIIWRYIVEENPRNVTSAIFQHLKQRIWKSITR